METLVVVAQHRKSNSSNGYMRFGSSPSGGYKDINCRTFDSEMGLLTSPFKGYGSPVMNRRFVSSKVLTPCGKSGGKMTEEEGYGSPVMNNRFVSSKVLTPCGRRGGRKSEEGKHLKKPVKSSPIAIDLKGGGVGRKGLPGRESLSFADLWAGPAYSNSPPPSSVPMPKFPLKPKRTVSLELPGLESDLNLQPMPKSAPASPTRESARSSYSFVCDDDCATKTLRRILNLDIADD